MPEIVSCLKEVSFAAGEVIFREGDPGDALYMISNGLVRVETDSVPIAIRKEGDCVGEMALVDGSARSSTLVAQTDVSLLRLSAEDFARLTTQHPEIASGVHRVLTAKLRENLPQASSATHRLTSVIPENNAAAPSLVLPQDLAGSIFAQRYRVHQMLGRGGMAYVYRADDALLGIPVALKILHRISEESILVRFKQEVILARKVVHPNVCRIFDFGQSGGLPYVSMEFIDGAALSQMLAQRFTLPDALPILRQVLQGLDAIHKTGIIHRDMKPHNIMIDRNGRTVIMDFGVALWTEASARLTEHGQFVGTLHYMAPEQFEGRIDSRADIYSVGVMLYEMFIGKRPFETGSTAAMVHAHLHIEPDKPTSLAENLPIKVEKIILKALEKQPEIRYQTALELLQDLEQANRN